MLAVISVGDALTTYKLLRVNIYANCMYLGMMSREGIVLTLTSWDNPIRVPSVIQSFLVTFFMAVQFSNIPVTITKSKPE